MQQSTDNPSVGDAAEPQAVTEVAPQAAESRPLQPANSDTPAATCMSRKREVLLFDVSLFPSLTAQLSAMKKYFEEPLSTFRRGERLAESQRFRATRGSKIVEHYVSSLGKNH